MSMKKYFLLMFLCFQDAKASDYFCLKPINSSSNVLMVSNDFSHVMYFPIRKKIHLSKLIHMKIIDFKDKETKASYSLVYNEIINKKNTGKYVFDLQGYLIYSASYENYKNNKFTEYSASYNDNGPLGDECIH